MVIPGMSSSLHSTAFGCQQQVKLQSSVGAVLTPHGCVDAHQKLGLLFCRSPLVSAAGIASGSWSVGDTVLPADGFCGTAHPHLKNSIIHRALRSSPIPHPFQPPWCVPVYCSHMLFSTSVSQCHLWMLSKGQHGAGGKGRSRWTATQEEVGRDIPWILGPRCGLHK